MQNFILVDHTHGAGLVHIYGIIQAVDASAAAASIGSEIESSDGSGVIMNQHGVLRHRLKESKCGSNEWFLEEVRSVVSRPSAMDRTGRF